MVRDDTKGLTVKTNSVPTDPRPGAAAITGFSCCLPATESTHIQMFTSLCLQMGVYQPHCLYLAFLFN